MNGVTSYSDTTIEDLESITSAPEFADLKIIDIDSHWTEPHDLWTSRVSRKYKDVAPRVVEKDDDKYWVIGKDTVIQRASPVSMIGKKGEKMYGGTFLGTSNIEDVHESSYDLVKRLDILDALGIHAQIVYPNIGFSAINTKDVKAGREIVRAYNDAALEQQELTNGRMIPMIGAPTWDVKEAVMEIDRCYALGARGITISSDVHSSGEVPSLAHKYWDPMWEICQDKALSVNFHVGNTAMGKVILDICAFPEYGPESDLALSSCSLFVDNGRIVGNIIYSGLLERFPKLKFVSVESGVGWLPFYLESLDHQLVECAAKELSFMTMKPSDYFKRNFYGSFWFESGMGQTLAGSIEALGADNIMFETDYPHPTCLYPGPLAALKKSVSPLDADVRRKLLQDNAAKLYKVDIS